MLCNLHPSRLAKGVWWNRALGINKGCTKESRGCLYCWSETESHMRGANPLPWAQKRWGGVTDMNGHWNGKVVPLPERLNKVRAPHKPTVWALWNDLFHEKMTDNFILQVFGVMQENKPDTFVVLTKRPQRMGDWLNGDVPVTLPNVILCISAEDQERLEERAPDLIAIHALGWKTGLHLAPMLGPIELKEAHRWLNWVVVEGESGKNARYMNPDWARVVRDQCLEAGVPFWMKQMTKKGPIPDDLLIRQYPRKEAA